MRLTKGMSEGNRAAERWLEAGAVVTAFLMPIAFWPAAALPFSTAKFWLLAVWLGFGMTAACATGLHRRRVLPGRFACGLAVWGGALGLSAVLGLDVSLQALLEALLPMGHALLLLWIAPRARSMILALIGSSTLVAAVAILQCLGLDPFRLFHLAGSLQGNSRILIFSTLGNPNFVASFLSGVLPLTAVCALTEGNLPKVAARAAILIQTGALVATGSRAPILAILAAGGWLLFRRAVPWLRYVVAGLAIAAMLIAWSPARPLQKTIAGRLYIWQVVARHMAGIPMVGYGPGSFVLRYSEWEAEALRGSPGETGRPFAGIQDHAHNDFLEILVEEGWVGFAAFLAMLALLIRIRRKASSPAGRLEDGLIASVAALLAIGIVDFPLHRPTEIYLLWTNIALLWNEDGARQALALPTPGPSRKGS
jgi:O-antigen ligase